MNHRAAPAKPSRRIARRPTVMLLLVLLSGGCNAPRWVHEYELGRRTAGNEKKPLLLYFTDLLANEHYDLNRKLFGDPAVQKELLGFVNVALNYHWGPAPKQYRVTRPYVCIICDGAGQELTRIPLQPMPAAAEFAKRLAELRASAAPPADAPAPSAAVPPAGDTPRTGERTSANPPPTGDAPAKSDSQTDLSRIPSNRVP